MEIWVVKISCNYKASLQGIRDETLIYKKSDEASRDFFVNNHVANNDTND